MPSKKLRKTYAFWARATPVIPKWAISYMRRMGWQEGSGLGVNLEGVLEYPKAVKNISLSGLGYDRLLEATEEGKMVVCYNPRDESHWEDCNFGKSKPNHEEYHYYKHEMVFVSPRNDQETLEMAAATLPGVLREPWNGFDNSQEQERVCKKAGKPLGSS